MKKLLLILMLLVVLLVASPVFGADTEVQDLTDITSPALGDDLYIVDDPDGTPASKKINIGALLGVANDLDTNGDVADDSHTHTTSTIKMTFSAGMTLQTPDSGDTESFHFAQFDWTATALTGHTNIQDDGSDTVTVKISEYSSAGVFISTLGTITFDGDSPADSPLTSFTVNNNNQLVLEITSQSGAPKSAMITVEGTED